MIPMVNLSKTALLVIDITNMSCHENCEKWGITFSKIRKMVPKLKRFIKQFREIARDK